eukprot:3220482-Amphidinium_carterae.2
MGEGTQTPKEPRQLRDLRRFLILPSVSLVIDLQWSCPFTMLSSSSGSAGAEGCCCHAAGVSAESFIKNTE